MSTKATQIREGDVETPDAELAEGWISIKLEEHVYIAGRIGWRGLKAEEYTAAGPILLSVPNLNYGDTVNFRHMNHISRARYEESPEIQVRRGDILLVKDGAGIGKLGYVDTLPADATVNSSLLLVRPINRLIYAKYLFYYFKGPEFQSIALNRITGSATPHLFQKDIKRFQILVAPLDEQYRIAQKIETLSDQVDNARTRLSKLPSLIKNFRQAVLAAACSGKLTEDWRQLTTAKRSSNELLTRILKRRKEILTANHRWKYRDPFEPDDSGNDFPDTWESATLDQLTSLVTSGSRGWARYYSDCGSLFIRAENINRDYLDMKDIAHVSPPKGAEGARTRVQTSDLLVTITGANVTKSALVDREIGEAFVSQHIGLVRPVEILTAPYLYLWIVSPIHGRRKLIEDAYGAGKPGLNLDNIREMFVALPPIEEQNEIVRRVQSLFTLGAAIEKRVGAATLRAKRLTQAILAKAFRGQLLPTEAEVARREGREYEPAPALLERIRKEMVAAQQTPTRPSRRPRKTRNVRAQR